MLQCDFNFLYCMLQFVNYFVSQPVGLDIWIFTSGSGFCQWVWIVPVGLDMKTPWDRLPAISCDPTHNHGIREIT